MIKSIFGAKRRPGMSREDFAAYWTTTHAEKAKRLPGVRRYIINLSASIGGSTRELAYDGFAEVWFDDLEALRRATSSPEYQVVLADEPNLFDPPTMFRVVVEEHPMIEDGALTRGSR